MEPKWNKNDAALVKWGYGYVLRRVLFVTEDGRPVVKIAGQYQIPGTITIKDPQWFKTGRYKWLLFWRIDDRS